LTNMNEETKSKVGDLQDTLYSRTSYHDPLGKRSPVRELEPPTGEPEVKETWQSPELNELLTREREVPEIHPFMKKFFVFALLFFTATILVAGVIFLGGTNFISSKNVDIEVVGPTSVSAGEVLELGVTIKNSNNTDLELANLSVQYPPGSRDPDDSSKTLTFTKDEIGVIRAGDEVARNIPIVLIGTMGETKEIKFSVEYKVKGSNATFYKDKVYEITIGNAPMSITVESPPSVVSGDIFITTVKLKLNSTNLLKNAMLKAEYPYGYSVVSTTPAALSENNVWALGDLSPGTEKTIQIRGRLVGENQDERTFRFYGGVADNGSVGSDFKSVIVSAQDTVAIERPSIGLNVTFNGDASPVYVAPAGRSISTTIRFQNNLPDKVLNPRLSVKLVGGALDRSSVRAQNEGFYNSANDTITWTISNLEGGLELLPGQGGTVNFTFASVAQSAIPIGSRDIALEISLSGTPLGAKPITISEARSVRVASQVNLTSRAFHSIGPFKNTGPIPPKVEATTTYSVVWNIGNTQDDIIEAKVTARLGQGVKWLASKSALSEDISYDETSNTVTWNLVNLSSGLGFSVSGREVAFQVALVPSLSQLGTAPILVTGIAFSGRDATSGNTVTVSTSPLTTRLSYDPAFIQGDDIVQKK